MDKIRSVRVHPPSGWHECRLGRTEYRERGRFKDSRERIFTGPGTEIRPSSGLVLLGLFLFREERPTPVAHHPSCIDIKCPTGNRDNISGNFPVSFDAFEPMRLVFNAISSSGVANPSLPQTSLHLSSVLVLFLLVATLWNHCQQPPMLLFSNRVALSLFPFFLGWISLVAASPSNSDAVADPSYGNRCVEPQIRREWRTLSVDDKAEWVNAVKVPLPSTNRSRRSHF